MNWREEYKRKSISAEEAAGLVHSGDRILIAPPPEPIQLELALAARRGDLKGVEITHGGPEQDCGWYDEGWEESFPLDLLFCRGPAHAVMEERRADFTPFPFSLQFKSLRDDLTDRKAWDFYLTPISAPDRHGFCSFGHALWWKKSALKWGKTVIAEVDANQIRTYGNNTVHVSEIDYFVEHTSPPPKPLFDFQLSSFSKPIAGYVSELVKNGDTIQVGTGGAAMLLGMLGTFDNKRDLGVHTELTFRGMVDLVKRGIITGNRKTLHRGKVIASTVWVEEGALEFAQENPMIELHDLEYVCDPRVIAAHDNMVSIQQPVAVDLTGQIAATTIGPQIWSGTGGHLDFAMGAMFSKGGRLVEVLPATARGGKVSRIVPQFEPGTVVTVPRDLACYVVTEYGTANLCGKSIRQRAEQLMAIAHPDFRADLRKAAQRLFYP